MSSINQSELEEIHEAVLLNGTDGPSDNDILEIFGEAADVDAVRKAYAKAYPATLSGDKPAEANPKPKATPAKSAAKPAPVAAAAKTPQPAAVATGKRIVLRHADGTSSDLELVKETGSAFFVKLPEPKAKDEVVVQIKGAPVVVDINELLELPKTEHRHGLPVATLLMIAAAAK